MTRVPLRVRSGGALDHQRAHRVAVLEAHPVLQAVAPDRQLQPFAERVDHRNAHAVEPARNLVGVVVAGVLELPAGVELGHDDLGRRHALFLVHVGGNAAAIVLDAHRAIGVEFDQHQIAMARQRLVDGVVRNLEHHVVQARTVISVADVHPGPLAHRVEALEDLDAVGAILVLVGVGRGIACSAVRQGVRRGVRSRADQALHRHLARAPVRECYLSCPSYRHWRAIPEPASGGFIHRRRRYNAPP